MPDTVTVPLDKALADEAADLGIDLRGVAEDAIAKAANAERNRRWVAENREALDRYAERIDTEGCALEKYRLF